jgi:hypothetical protein
MEKVRRQKSFGQVQGGFVKPVKNKNKQDEEAAGKGDQVRQTPPQQRLAR